VLVDHNRMAESVKHLESRVVEIVDHHVDEGLFSPITGTKRNICYGVGSCVTLVAEQLAEECKHVLEDPVVCSMILSTIVIDTNGLDSSKKVFSERDVNQIRRVEAFCPEDIRFGGDIQKLYQFIVELRTDVFQFSSEEILKRDCKSGRENGVSFTIAAVSVSLQSLLAHRADFCKAVEDWAQDFDLGCVMTAFNGEDESFHRQILLHSRSDALLLRFVDEIRKLDFKTKEFGFEPLLLPEFSPHPKFLLFSQTNTKASRKQVMPAIAAIASNL